MTFEEAAALIRAAKSPRDLFPMDDPGARQAHFRELARACHPDRVAPEWRTMAEQVFASLSAMYAALTKPASPRPATPPLVGNWLVTESLHRGALNDLYLVQNTKADPVLADTKRVMKIARHPRDNGLLKREATALQVLTNDDRGERFQRYIPYMIDKFEASYRRANILTYDPDVVSLEVIRRLNPGGVDFRHIVWMMNRLLSVLGFAHHNGIVHGAVLPHHLLYRPSDHGLQLVDWTCACATETDRVPYLASRYKDLYPVEVLYTKGTAYPQTDIYMAFSSLRYAAGPIPYRFRALFDWCLIESWKARPSDAWGVQDRWVRLAAEEYGPPRFVEFKVAVN